jgi:hypothetical protein
MGLKEYNSKNYLDSAKVLVKKGGDAEKPIFNKMVFRKSNSISLEKRRK